MGVLAVEEMVDTINLQYPPEIVQYYSPNYVWSLAVLVRREPEAIDIKGIQVRMWMILLLKY